jgi:DNA-binding NtrC family response regulator
MNTVSLCVHDDILQSVKWLLAEFNRDFSVTSFRSLESLESAYATKEWDLLILDAAASHESMRDALAKIKTQNPHLKIILIVPPGANREEILEIINGKMVQGLVIKPFTGEVISRYLEKVGSTGGH